ncbi:MAG: DsbA family protein [Myxococcota bacterium]
MAQNNNAGATVIGALIIGAAIVAAALLIQGSVQNAADEVASLKETFGQIAAPTRPEPRRADRPGRPDPSRRYAVNTKGSPAKGDAKALKVIEFSDFQCPFCNRVMPTLRQVEQTYGDKVQIVFKHLPLSIHPKAPAAHAAAEAAHKQGKFWEMHDKIFSDQRGMSEAKYLAYAAEIGLDVDQFKKDLQDPGVRARVEADTAEAARLGVSGTPAFFINGRFLSGAQPFAAFKALIDEELGKG